MQIDIHTYISYVKNGYEKKLIDQLLFNKIKKSTLESIYSQKSQKEIIFFKEFGVGNW